MKRIAALILSLCLLLTVTSAFAETATVTRVDFGAFSMELDSSALVMQEKANNAAFALYLPVADDTSINMNLVWTTDTEDISAITQEYMDAYAEYLLSTLINYMESQGVEVIEAETITAEMRLLDDAPVLLIAHGYTYDLTPLGVSMQQTRYQIQVTLPLENETYIITCTVPDLDAFQQYFVPVINSLQWN